MSIEDQILFIIKDMEGKIYRKDWHGVADCAMDLRELEAFRRGKEQKTNG